MKRLLLEVLASVTLTFLLYYPLSWLTKETQWSAAIAVGVSVFLVMRLSRRYHGR